MLLELRGISLRGGGVVECGKRGFVACRCGVHDAGSLIWFGVFWVWEVDGWCL